MRELNLIYFGANAVLLYIQISSSCIMPKRVTSGWAHLCVIVPAGNTTPFEKMLQQWRDVGNTVFNLTGRRLKPLTFRSRDERVTAL